MPDQRQHARYPGQRDHAGDDGRRRQHDADLEGRRGEFVVMIFGGREVALVLGMLGALGKLLGTFAGLRLGAIARRGLLPVVDLLLQRRLGGIVADGPRLSLACSEAVCTTVRRMLLAWKNAHRFEASTFLLMDFGLRALAECLRKRQAQARSRRSAARSSCSRLKRARRASACSMLSCALMIFSRRGLTSHD